MSQEGAEVQGGADAVQQELKQLRTRMAAIKEKAAAEVDRNWGSAFRTPAVFDLKVKSRLAGNKEYRSLQDRVRDVEAGLAGQSDTSPEADSAS